MDGDEYPVEQTSPADISKSNPDAMSYENMNN